MLDSKIIENDLIPILIHLDNKQDVKIINHTLKYQRKTKHIEKNNLKYFLFRLLVNLTKPPLVCFDGKIPKDVTLTNIYLKIENHLQKTKTVR
jgi:hypothetical protein